MSLSIQLSASSTALQQSAPPAPATVEEPHRSGASFHDLCRAQQLETYGSIDELILSVPEETIVGNVLRHWRIAEKVCFFDLLALELLQGLGNAHPGLDQEFIDLYRECMLCAEFENLKLEEFCFDNHQPKFAAFKRNMISALIKSLGADRSPARIEEIKRLERTLCLLMKYLEDPLSRKILIRKSLAFYYEQTPIGAFSKEQQGVYLNLMRALSPLLKRDLDPAAFERLAPAQFYAQLAAANDSIHTIIKTIGHRVKAQGWSKEDAQKTGALNFAVRRVAALKHYFETELLRKDKELIETRGLESLTLYSELRCFAKGLYVSDRFNQIMHKIEAELGPDFDGVLNRILEKGKLDPWMRDLSCFERLRSIMALVKREIKSFHAELSSREWDNPKEIEEDYRDCFDTLSALFVALHDMQATQNANYDQLQDRHLPDDLVACAVLSLPETGSSPSDTPAPSLEDFEEAAPQEDLPPPSPAPQPDRSNDSAASTALLPAAQEPAASPSPTQMQAAPAFRRKTKSAAAEEPYEHKERAASPTPPREFNVPKTGTKPGKVGQFLLSQGFHLSSVNDHRYYTHSGVRVKVSSHDTLSPGTRQEILRALRELSAMGALE